VNEPTRISRDQNPSLLDLVIVSSPETLISNDYLPSSPLEKAAMLQFSLKIIFTAKNLLINIAHLLITKLYVEILHVLTGALPQMMILRLLGISLKFYYLVLN